MRPKHLCADSLTQIPRPCCPWSDISDLTTEALNIVRGDRFMTVHKSADGCGTGRMQTNVFLTRRIILVGDLRVEKLTMLKPSPKTQNHEQRGNELAHQNCNPPPAELAPRPIIGAPNNSVITLTGSTKRTRGPKTAQTGFPIRATPIVCGAPILLSPHYRFTRWARTRERQDRSRLVPSPIRNIANQQIGDAEERHSTDVAEFPRGNS